MDQYKSSGVDRNIANRLIKKIKGRASKLNSEHVYQEIGGFSGAYSLDGENLIVSSADGVGTKIAVARLANSYKNIGIDVVAMVVNDIIVCGAKPLFFLDYIAFSMLEAHVLEEVIDGLALGLEMAKMDLLGGETAQMPNFYQDGLFDIAGFGIGMVKKNSLITGQTIKAGNVIIGLESSGIHSNGFSLVRKIFFDDLGYSISRILPELGKPLSEVLLAPTKIYVNIIERILSHKITPRGMVHITGGGFTENIPRVLPDTLKATINCHFPIPAVFSSLMHHGKLKKAEALGIFNMGVGFIVIVDKKDSDGVFSCTNALGEKAHIIGYIDHRNPNEPQVIYRQ